MSIDQQSKGSSGVPWAERVANWHTCTYLTPMQMERVRSGITGVGDLPWGTHFCQFYRSRDDLADSLVPFFKAGLESNEQCLWVTAEPFRAADARDALRRAVPDLAQREKQGQIEVLDYTEWYRRSGRSTAKDVLQGWIDRQSHALERGYRGLRLTGNTFFLESQDWDGFIDYENLVNQSFGKYRIVALCSYCLSRCEPEHVIDVVRNHEFALIRRSGDWELIESATLKMAKDELRELNEELEARVQSRTEELTVALRARDEFLAVASHELKTPIASLKLFVDSVVRARKKGTLDPEQIAARLLKAQEQCGRLERLINDLLDVSRASVGKAEELPMELERANLAELLRATCERLGDQLEHADIALTQRLDDSVECLVDRARFDQVVTNLLTNAMKYAPGAPVEVTLSREGEFAKLAVRDHGPGIAPKDQSRVFERFVQVGASTHGGFGLGLWLARRTVEALDGSLTVSSIPGQGATFSVVLPLSPQAS